MTVVVGVEGLPHSLAAIWMGHEEAERRRAESALRAAVMDAHCPVLVVPENYG